MSRLNYLHWSNPKVALCQQIKAYSVEKMPPSNRGRNDNVEFVGRILKQEFGIEYKRETKCSVDCKE